MEQFLRSGFGEVDEKENERVRIPLDEEGICREQHYPGDSIHQFDGLHRPK